ncbi:MAG TPA: MarR family transcriptional regulator [Polyangiaceae bacterium]|nr:MarR family transcriptional regulator [Polyangiaceae bacterium]
MESGQVDWDPASFPTFWVNQASRLLMRRFEDQLRPLGLSMAYLHVAITLERNGPLQQKALLKFIHVEQPTMAALLKRMERDRLVTRKPDPNDSRAQLVTLTSRANTALARAKAAMSDVVTRAMAGIPEPDQTRLVKTLRLMLENLADDPSQLTGLGMAIDRS